MKAKNQFKSFKTKFEQEIFCRYKVLCKMSEVFRLIEQTK